MPRAVGREVGMLDRLVKILATLAVLFIFGGILYFAFR